MEPAVIGALAGVLGGVFGGMLRSFHLELQWFQTRRTLQKFFTQQRKTRIAELPVEKIGANGPLTHEDVERRYRERRLHGE